MWALFTLTVYIKMLELSNEIKCFSTSSVLNYRVLLQKINGFSWCADRQRGVIAALLFQTEFVSLQKGCSPQALWQTDIEFIFLAEIRAGVETCMYCTANLLVCSIFLELKMSNIFLGNLKLISFIPETVVTLVGNFTFPFTAEHINHDGNTVLPSFRICTLCIAH